jgi:hypothetical protein
VWTAIAPMDAFGPTRKFALQPTRALAVCGKQMQN